ncbi:MAG: P-type conjugative transfer protein TrbJ [Alphaproteobacteria bacterium 65-7]|nr:MAG: P-type conjugative transfer protein TrbJ [Alphaproteobacteria bacterium 65-7]
MRKAKSLLLVALLTTSAVVPAQAQWTVFDPQNYAQNLLSAARALQQINNQIQALQNQAQMLQNMATDLSPLREVSQLTGMVNSLTRITSLMNQAQGIAFDVDSTMSAWSRAYPTSRPAGTSGVTLAADAQQRWQNSMSAFQDTLKIQSQVVQNVQADTATLTKLTDQSQNATGNLAVSQATNQLIALSTKQQLQIQSLMAAQYRASALDQARNAQAEQDGKAQFETFLGDRNAYNPQ